VVPYGQVWRTGANAATMITFSHAAKVAGKEVPAGSYAFFAIPGVKAWTLILNRKASQWGASDYKQEEDLLRWEATPQAGPFLESLDYRVLPVDSGNATVELGWEKLRVSFPVMFDTKAIYWTHLEETLKKAPETDWVPWYQAARYCQTQGIEPQKALAWIEKSLKIHEDFLNHETAARIYRDAKLLPEALTHLQKAIELSRGKAPKDYTENLEKEWTSWKPTN
jgi:tetratricopeptide (TPR) repeat protein